MANTSTVLMGHDLKAAIERLSQPRLVLDTKTIVKHGKYSDKKREKCKKSAGYYKAKAEEFKKLTVAHKMVGKGYGINYTVNAMKVVIGAGGKRKSVLQQHGLPGSKVVMWMLDSPITKYWQGKVRDLAKELGVSKDKTFDVYDD